MKVEIPTDKQWKKQREKRWNDVWASSLKVHGESKVNKEEATVIAAQKQWYIEGDLTSLMTSPDNLERNNALSLSSVMMLCPIMDVKQYVNFFQDYALWASEHNLSYWGNDKLKRDERFVKWFFQKYAGDHKDSTKEIYENMLSMILPDNTGVVTFPLKLGVDNWQPKQQVALCDFAFDILKKIGRYLFSDDNDYGAYSHISIALPIVPYFKDINPQLFDTKLLESKPKRPAPPPTPRRITSAGQKILRSVLGHLQGLKSNDDDYEGELRHNGPEVEQQLRDLLASLPMPDEYHQLIEFIHANPEDYVTRSK